MKEFFIRKGLTKMLLKKIIFTISFILLCIFIAFPQEKQVFLVIDAPDMIESLDVNTPIENYPGDDTLPIRWRMSTDSFKNHNNITLPVRTGLDKLNISGSKTFSTGQFEKMRQALQGKKVIVVDLREESHGILNNMCISWFNSESDTQNNLNAGKEPDEILTLEKELLNTIKEKKEVEIDCIKNKEPWINLIKNKEPWKTSKMFVKVSSVMTEEELVTKYGYGYHRIFVTDRHTPKDKQVDNFITFYNKLSPDIWLHFHCRAGIGRTTLFMAMYDMMRNYDNVSAEDIIKRQWLIGGMNLLEIDNNYPEERIQFILKFYEYCRHNGPDYKIMWSEWIKSH